MEGRMAKAELLKKEAWKTRLSASIQGTKYVGSKGARDLGKGKSISSAAVA